MSDWQNVLWIHNAVRIVARLIYLVKCWIELFRNVFGDLLDTMLGGRKFHPVTVIRQHHEGVLPKCVGPYKLTTATHQYTNPDVTGDMLLPDVTMHCKQTTYN